jgi:hypothetical protein
MSEADFLVDTLEEAIIEVSRGLKKEGFLTPLSAAPG